MITFNDVDPTTNPFNEFLKNYGLFIAIGVAVVVLATVIILIFVSQKHKGTKGNKINKVSSFDSNDVIKALGDKDNIVSVNLTGSRISVELKDVNKADETTLKNNSVKSIIKMSNKITLLVEGDSKEFYSRVFKSSGL